MAHKLESVNELVVENESQPTVILNEDGMYVGVNEAKLDEIGYDRDEMIGANSSRFLASGAVCAGSQLQKIISGEEIETELHQKRKDGSTYHSKKVGTPVEVGDKTYAKIVGIETREHEAQSASKKPDSSDFDNITDDELKRVVENVRVDAPEGKMPLNAVLLDLAVGHNELEQYKQGALSLYQALDERLEEEQKNNPDSSEAKVLEEAMDSAFGLYLRIQRGDLELHGNRAGAYSGYFN